MREREGEKERRDEEEASRGKRETRPIWDEQDGWAVGVDKKRVWW